MAEPEQPASRTVVAFADARFGAVLTHREDAHGQLADVQLELHHPPPLGPEALAVLIRCELLRVRARRFLGTNNLTATLAVISGVLVGFLRSLPAPAKDRTSRVRLALAALLHSELAGGLASAPQGPPAASLAVLNDGIQKGEKFYEQMVQRKVRIDYLIGVGIGILVVGGAVALSAVLLPSTVGGEPKAQVAGALGAGLIGGVVSVMSRALSGQIVLDRELGGFWLNTVGAVRPAIGALFGLVLYFFLQAGLVPINPNATPTHLFFFTSAVAFAAGFSERLVPDLINRLESKV